MRQNIDIWSLGCVFSEAVRWLPHTYRGIVAYSAERKAEIDNIPSFNGVDCFHNGQKALTAVRESNEKAKKTLLRKDFITDKVMEMIGDMLVPAEERPDTRFLWSKQIRILESAKDQLASLTSPTEEPNALLPRWPALSPHNTLPIPAPKQPVPVAGDSGYGSVSHPWTLTASSGSASQDNNIEQPTDDLHRAKYPDDNEIMSLSSDNDDINSQASDRTTNAEMAGKALMGVFLAEEPQFRSLCEKVMALMGSRRFKENMRRLLKSFYKNLSTEAKTEAEKATSRLLRGRRGRYRISQQLALQIQQEHDEEWNNIRIDLKTFLEDKNLVETWLAHVSEKPVDPLRDVKMPECAFEGEDVHSESSTPASDESSSEGEFPYISELKHVIQKSRAFQILLKDCLLMFLPIDLRCVLLSIPKRHVWVSRRQDFSVANWFKTLVEETTQVRWNWWPLESRKRMLEDDESRMLWQCVRQNSYYGYNTYD